jgi:hypothetical protein
MRAQVADRAFEAEADARVLIAETLTALNDLRDAGLLHVGLKDFALGAVGEKGLNPAALIRAAKDCEGASAFPPGMLDEMAGDLERRNVSISYDKDANALALTGRGLLDPHARVTRVRLDPRPGDFGRVGVDEFFSASARHSFHTTQPAYAPPGFHHQEPASGSDQVTLDLYSSVVASLAYARELMYRHARKVSEYGHGRATLRANDPAIASAFALLIVGVGLVAAGSSGADPLGLGNPTYDILFGAILIVGGILIFVWLITL